MKNLRVAQENIRGRWISERSITISLIMGWAMIMWCVNIHPTASNSTSTSSSASSTSSRSRIHDRFQGTEEDGAESYDNESPPYTVVIVGAGAAGLSAARRLKETGIERILVLEATALHGGRVRRDDSMYGNAWPLDAGASIVGDMALVKHIMNDSSWNQASREGARIYYPPGAAEMFYNYTFYDFLTDYLLPHAQQDKILYNCSVFEINFQGRFSKVQYRDNMGRQWTICSHFVIVTASLQVLRDKMIRFTPTSPLDAVLERHLGEMWHGIKIYIEFAERFWDPSDSFCLLDVIDKCEDDNGEAMFWEYPVEVEGIDTVLLAGFVVGDAVQEYFDIPNESEMVKALVRRMDKEFNTTLATESYVRHLVFNWGQEDYVRGTYSSAAFVTVRNLNNRVFLAGEAFPVYGEEHGFVHGAYFSGGSAAEAVASLAHRGRLI